MTPPPRVVAVAAWNGPVVVRRLAVGALDPAPAELAAVARAHVDDDGYGGQAALWAMVLEVFVLRASDGVERPRRGAPGFL